MQLHKLFIILFGIIFLVLEEPLHGLANHQDWEGNGCLYPWRIDYYRNLLRMGRGCDDSMAWTVANTARYRRHEDVIRRRSEAEFNRSQRAFGGDPI